MSQVSKDGPPFLFIFTAPSGAGKTTLVRHLLSTFKDQLSFSVSATSRQKRPHEQEGVDYYFKSVEEFKRLIAENAFLEWEEVYQDQFYGTLKPEIDRLLSEGKNVILDIDVEGALNLKKYYGKQAVGIFVVPPSTMALEDRLKNRQTETEESFRKRIKKAEQELSYKDQFNYQILNDDLDVSKIEAEDLIKLFI